MIGKDWAFKGGTSLKKCFFDTFRFSEDLDFTVQTAAFLSEDFLKKVFAKIIDDLSEEVGISFLKDKLSFEVIKKANGKISVEGKIYYNGPASRGNRINTIKLDLTNDEKLVLKPVVKTVNHPYSDNPPGNIKILAYSFEEVVAEKIRALAQRARPRDLYDVIHFFRNRSMIQNPTLVYNTLIKKCEYKKIKVPSFTDIENHEKVGELESEWENMLAHQLPALPPLEAFWRELEPFFNWLNQQLVENRVVSFSGSSEGSRYMPGRYENLRHFRGLIPKIQFAAANRVCISMSYNKKTRTVEPLSFRKTKAGDIIFWGYERGSNSAKSFRLDRIASIKITNTPYIEKYLVEISASGTSSMPPTKRKS